MLREWMACWEIVTRYGKGYETDILEVEKTNGLISIRFGVTPQIGAHNPLGYDELLYSIDSSGKV